MGKHAVTSGQGPLAGDDRESGLSARTIARCLPLVSGLYAYLIARGDTPVQVSPVPRAWPPVCGRYGTPNNTAQLEEQI